MGAEDMDIDYREKYNQLCIAYDRLCEKYVTLCRKFEQLYVSESQNHWENHEMRQMLEELIVAVTDCRKCVYNDSGCNLWDGGKCNLEERNVRKAVEMGIFVGSDRLVGGDE